MNGCVPYLKTRTNIVATCAPQNRNIHPANRRNYPLKPGKVLETYVVNIYPRSGTYHIDSERHHGYECNEHGELPMTCQRKASKGREGYTARRLAMRKQRGIEACECARSPAKNT